MRLGNATGVYDALRLAKGYRRPPLSCLIIIHLHQLSKTPKVTLGMTPVHPFFLSCQLVIAWDGSQSHVRMRPNLDTLRREIEQHLESRGMAVFRSYPRADSESSLTGAIFWD